MHAVEKQVGLEIASTCDHLCIPLHRISEAYINTSNLTELFSLAVWNSSYPFVHCTLLAAVTGIDSLTASPSLSAALPSPSSTLHFSISLLHLFQDYPQSLVLLAPELTCGGGKKMETQKARKTMKPWGNSRVVPSPPPVDCETHTTVRELTNCQSLD